MAYNSSTGKITAPVSIADLQSCFGTTETYLSYIIDDSNINMWAKYKPVVRNGLIDTTGQINNVSTNKTWKTSAVIEAGGHANAAWWRADNTNHGLTPKFETPNWNPAAFISKLTTVATFIDGKKNGWSYTRPSGGSSSPYRLLDFLQYNHKAPNPIIKSSGIDSVAAAATQAWTYSYELMEVVTDDGYDERDFLVPTDIKIDNTIWQTLYAGLAIYKKSGNTYSAMAWTVGNSWMGSGITDSTENVDAPSSGSVATATFKKNTTYYALPLYFTRNDLTQENITGGGTGKSFIGGGSGCKIITMPYTNFMPFTTTQTAGLQHIVFPSITNHKVTKAGKYTGKVHLSSKVDGYNGSTTSFTVYVYFALKSWDNLDAHITNQNVIFQSSKTYSSFSDDYEEEPNELSITNLTVDLEKDWKIVVKVNGEASVFNLIVPRPITL